jgi:hypothetical protein
MMQSLSVTSDVARSLGDSAGIEFEKNSADAKELLEILKSQFPKEYAKIRHNTKPCRTPTPSCAASQLHAVTRNTDMQHA